MTTYAVVDLEASNHPITNEKYIIQIGITYVENRLVSDTLTLDVKPPVPISQTITNLTGITNEQVANAPLFEDVAEYVATLLDGCVFVAHNVAFDYGLLVNEMGRVGVAFSEKIRLDTIELAQIVMPTQTSFALKTLSQQLDISLNHHHQAGDDSKATAHLFVYLRDQIAQLPYHVNEAIHSLLNSKNEGLAQLFKDIGVGSLHMLPKVIVNEEDDHLSVLHAVLSTRRFPKEVVYQSYEMFVDTQVLEYFTQHPDQLTIQEARQICRVIVSLLQDDATGNLNELQLPQKLFKKLGAKDTNNPYYQKHINQLKKQENIYITYYDFIKYFSCLQQHFDISKLTLQVYERNALQRIARRVQTKRLSVSTWISHLFALKSEWIQQSKDTQSIDNVLMDLFWVVDFLKNDQTTRLEKMEQSSMIEYYLSKVSEMDGYVFIRLKNMLENMKTLVSSGYQSELDELIAHIKECLTQPSPVDYVGVNVHKTDAITFYTIVIQPFSVAEYLTRNVFEAFRKVVFLDAIPHTSSVQTYVANMVDLACDVASGEETIHGELRVSRAHHSQNWKDNLMVKKIAQYIKTVNDKTLIVVPNQQIAQALGECSDIAILNDERSIDRYNDGLLSNNSAVITWHLFSEQYTNLTNAMEIIIVKLPFTTPDSLHVQASKDFLPKRQHYFTTIDVVSVLLDMSQVVISRHEKGSITLWDERIFHDSYGHVFMEGLSQIVKIVEV
ncbi:hypothetical protein KG089_06195 [Carnobacteriaceae bacterium zg-ZUI252]|nr:hypothetical protein [Carnobacteriaceae bacterium zg-ZUI252]